MQVKWKNETQSEISLKNFLSRHGVSHRMYSALKSRDDSFKIDNQKITPQRKISSGETVTVVFPPETADPNVLISHQQIEIIYEDDNWMIVNKPAGLTTVPGPSNRTDTLVNRIKGHLVAEHTSDLRPHIITRLDRFTSGLVLVAKNRLANSYANQQLASHQIDKRYLTVVAGRIEYNHGMIDLPIGRVDNNFAREVTPAGQDAKTEYWVKNRLPTATVLEVKLHTGRTHQIRVHFTDAGHPLLGDELYHGPLNQGIKRQALHAVSLQFYDPFQKRELSFKAAVPADMLKYV
ncbi:RNA pseudouridine synthase [Fructilactobacillus lindneri]|uniref:Pseudouridine synthase n=2 Tax=Fructilactobacillus lindneri TaxID=53444 RepID=A0A0R2JNB3_9LACO|nr:RluA family pseudouridine synthase [Fructilactobacillus lindneri]ANZ57886.1 RNA pseudouridine synthase [Fructilactobacillus lindneri]ANZ59155.1 RNA pseudouridine synthase [Fructilactobacillus lindneri]KRN78649.1 hypothetical protein IV52_GL000925 [Fructilactobacillus lindneri DSM 20690 = JCM 11027]POG98205.1 RNA pseudouridine synthase [Fructilactobacillus lindneri]POH01678.1 RNA pseudouridine synthase [Fructilactobacillus lindneri]